MIYFTLIFLTATSVFCKEVEGDKAKNIVLKGEVIGMALFDDFLKKIFEEKEAGFIYGVKFNNEIYHCYHSRNINWFCESFN